MRHVSESRAVRRLTKNEDGTIAIDETMCNGCGLCKQLCKFDAIEMYGTLSKAEVTDSWKTKNIMIVGVGGQGTLLTSRVLGGIIQEAGYDVKLSEVHGMAQRGGSVVTFVRYGDKGLRAYCRRGAGRCADRL